MKKLSVLTALVLFPLISFANESQILSDTKQEIIKLKEKQIKEKQKDNKYDWILDANINASIQKDEDDSTSKDYNISISQDIFKFGGITSQIDYANQLKKMESLDLDISTKEDLSTLFSYLVDVKINDISLEQNKLYLLNSQIDIRSKQSEYKAGELGISDLNEAIMTKNELSDTQKELNLTKLVNINSIKEYTNKSYKEIEIPDVKLMSKDIYLENASSVNYVKLDIDVNNSLYKIKKSDYLPTLALTGQYGYQDSSSIEGDDYYNYGLNISIPLSYTASNDIEQTKLDYLISQKELSQELTSSKATYDEVVLSIKSYEDRINLALNDIKLYSELLEVNEEEYKAGYKTIDDVETIKNSKMIRELDIKSYKLNIQKQILKLYFKV
ncbi:MAG: TolC family protein [Poseidonibacter sp.]